VSNTGNTGAIISDEGLVDLHAEIERLTAEVASLERLTQEPVPGEDRQRLYARLLDVEARLEHVIAEVRALNRQITLIESWRRR
jgi:hypothetical protein